MDWMDYRRRKVFEAAKALEQPAAPSTLSSLPKGRVIKMPDSIKVPPRP
jgi:hypothetical protein